MRCVVARKHALTVASVRRAGGAQRCLEVFVVVDFAVEERDLPSVDDRLLREGPRLVEEIVHEGEAGAGMVVEESGVIGPAELEEVVYVFQVCDALRRGQEGARVDREEEKG